MNIAIFGATSAIAQATAQLYAAAKPSFFLVARDGEKLEQVAADLRARGASAMITTTADLADIAAQQKVMEALKDWGHPDIALLAWGTLPKQEEIERDVAASMDAFTLNGSSVIALMTSLAAVMQTAGSGTLAVIASVAADRGRRSNYIYGAAKAAVSTYAAGLRARLYPFGVRVLTIKPGFVDTPMTADFPKNALWATPETIAAGIKRAIEKGRNEVYLPWFWLGIMGIIRHIPEEISKRLKY